MPNNELLRGRELETKNRILLLTGISGSGKDFLLNAASQGDDRLGKSIAVVNFGELLFEKMKTRQKDSTPAVTSRDDLRKKITKDMMHSLVSEGIETVIGSQPVIFNTHVVYLQNGKLTFNPDIMKRLNVATYGFVWSSPHLIQQWRQESNRNRDQESLEAITTHQDMALTATRILARTVGANFTVLENGIDNLDENVQRLHQLVGTIC